MLIDIAVLRLVVVLFRLQQVSFEDHRWRRGSAVGNLFLFCGVLCPPRQLTHSDFRDFICLYADRLPRGDLVLSGKFSVLANSSPKEVRFTPFSRNGYPKSHL